MTTTRRRLLGILLMLAGGYGLFLLGLAWWLAPEPNYSQIEEGLYQGGAVPRPPRGTQVVINLCRQEDSYPAEVSIWEPVPDSAPAPRLAWLRRLVELIDSHRREGRTVYVHCRNGISRSGMVVTAYLMFKNGWTRDEALAFVRTRRPQTRPNPAFMERLLEWERELKNQPAGEEK